MGFSWAVHICNHCWVRVIPPKLRAIPPKSADIFFDFTGASIQQSILPKLVYNDGIPPKAVFNAEIWKFCRNPKSAKTSIRLEFSGGITLFVLASLLPPSTETSLPWLLVFAWSVPNAHQAKESPKSNRLYIGLIGLASVSPKRASWVPIPYTQSSEPSLPHLRISKSWKGM